MSTAGYCNVTTGIVSEGVVDVVIFTVSLTDVPEIRVLAVSVDSQDLT